MNSNSEEAQFDIYIDFVRGEGAASRVFHAMGELIDAFGQLDQLLAGVIAEMPETELVLDEVKGGSVKSRLRSIIHGIPDEALRDGEWKKLLGHFLIRAKYIVCEWLNEHSEITSLEQVQSLQDKLARAAEETGARHLPIYRPLNNKNLLSSIAELDRAIATLDPRDTIRYESPLGNVVLPHTQHVHEELIRQLLTSEVLISDDERIVKVKKPDYLGRSQWLLKYAGHTIYASIDHSEWLNEFQLGNIDLKPGDSLRVLMHEEVFYGYNMEVVHISRSVREVREVIHPLALHQSQITF